VPTSPVINTPLKKTKGLLKTHKQPQNKKSSKKNHKTFFQKNSTENQQTTPNFLSSKKTTNIFSEKSTENPKTTPKKSTPTITNNQPPPHPQTKVKHFF
jgi:hypothetical protein